MATILHIDMNAFFAAVEQRENPALRERPIAVVGSEQRGVVLSPSYEARAFGVKTGMLPFEARRLCPEIALVPSDPAKYAHACRELVAVWNSITPLVELFSIDEAFLDVTGCEALLGDPVRIALTIKERTWLELGLTCSIGIGPNKLLAKLGSDLVKPDGLVVISPDDVAAVLADRPVSDLCGIGPSLTQRLAAAGIHTCGELGCAPLGRLTALFGVLGGRLKDMGQGVDHDPVIPLEDSSGGEAKSVGHSMTLAEDCSDTGVLEQRLLEIADMVGRRLRRGLYAGSTVALTVRFEDFQTISRQRKLDRRINHSLDIYRTAAALLRELMPLRLPVRLLGVSVSGLARAAAQLPLFADERKKRYLAEAMDAINDRYGEHSVTWGTLAERSGHQRVISPAWRPGGDRHY